MIAIIHFAVGSCVLTTAFVLDMKQDLRRLNDILSRNRTGMENLTVKKKLNKIIAFHADVLELSISEDFVSKSN